MIPDINPWSTPNCSVGHVLGNQWNTFINGLQIGAALEAAGPLGRFLVPWAIKDGVKGLEDSLDDYNRCLGGS